MGESPFFDESLSAIERNLYDRQFRLEGWDQRILKDSRVLVAGVGGLGCEIAKNLAMVGVGYLDLVDLDIIEHSNLNRQILFVGGNMGESKAKVAAEKLKEVNPHITIIGHHCSLEELDPSIYQKADLIVGGLDSMRARINLNAQAVRFNKPLLDGGVSGYHGHVYTIFPFQNQCFECHPVSQPEEEDMAACTVVGIPRKRIHCLLKGVIEFREKFDREPNPKHLEDLSFIRDYANNLVRQHNFPPEFDTSEVVKRVDAHDPGIITINAVIASIQSQEAVKILNWLKGNSALGEPMKTYMIFNGMTMKFYHLEKRRNPQCPQCGESAKRENITLSSSQPTGAIVQALIQKGYSPDPYMEPIITINEFKGLREIELEPTLVENKIRNLELVTVAGFEEGEVSVTVQFS